MKKGILILISLALLATVSLNAQDYVFSNWWYSIDQTIAEVVDPVVGYQVKFTIHFGAGTDEPGHVYLGNHPQALDGIEARTDFGDIRFVENQGFFDGGQELSYWMQEKVDENYAIFWVKLHGDLGADDIRVSVMFGYYDENNPSAIATTTSNGEATFDFFDDFTDGLGKWETHVALDDGFIEIPTDEEYVRLGGGGGTDHGHTVLGSSPTYVDFDNNAVLFRYKVSADAIAEVGFRGDHGANTGYKGRSDQREDNAGQSILDAPYLVGEWDFIVDADGDRPDIDTWYIGEITALGNNFALFRDADLKVVASDLQYPGPGEISLQNHYGDYTDFDWVAVRKEIDCNIVIQTGDMDTKPVELSSFNAIVTNDMFVQVEWTAETETNMMGYNIYRSHTQNINEAVKVNGTIIGAHNSSEPMDYIYVDETVESGKTYYYWLQANDLDLTYNFHGPISILVNDEGEPGTGITPELVTALKGAYPNPFNPGTNVSFSLAEAADVTITIYNNKGQLVRTLVDNQSYNKGDHHSEYWDGTDLNGRTVSSGIYYYIMRTNDGFEQSKKMMLMK